jgi:hypothetical protein
MSRTLEQRVLRSPRFRWVLAGTILIGGLLSSAATVPFFFIAAKPAESSALSLRMPITHDLYLHLDQMKSFYEGLSAGEIYPRWEMDVNRGFGAPTFGYYPPGVYYVTSIFFALGSDGTGATFGAMLAMVAASAFAVYVYARRFFGRLTSIAVMSVYVFWPYHLVDLYQRGALAEMMAFVWMPLMLFFADRLMDGEASLREIGEKQRNSLSIAGLGGCYGAFLWSHPPTAYQFSLVFGFYILTRCALQRRIGPASRIAGGLGLGLALGAAYLLPAIAGKDLVRADSIQTQFPYREGYVFGDPSRYGGTAIEFFRQIDLQWCVAVAVLIIGCAVYWMMRRRGATTTQLSRYAGWLMALAAACVLMTSPSEHLTAFLPGITFGVFPWRLLSVTTVVGALVTGSVIDQASRHRQAVVKSKSRGFQLFATTASILVAVLAVTAGIRNSILSYIGSEPFAPEGEHLNYAMLPRSAISNLEAIPQVDESTFAQGRGTIEVERWTPGRRVLKVNASAREKLLVRTFNFPGWSASVDGQSAEIVEGRTVAQPAENAALVGTEAGGLPPQQAVGDIGILLSPGEHVVSLEFRATPIRKVGASITLAASIATIIMILWPLAASKRREP